MAERADALKEMAKRYIERDIAVDDIPQTEQVFTLFLDDPSPFVRAAMAEALAPCDFLPRTLVWSLSRDIPEVAAPMLKTSPLLGVNALVHAARDGDPKCQAAVAARQDIDAKTVRTLVAFGAPEAVLALLQNDQVLLSADLKHDLAKRHADDAELREALLEDEGILPQTRQLLVHGLACSLVDFASSHFSVDEARLRSVANRAASLGSVELVDGTDAKTLDGYVEHLRDTDQLTPTLLLRAVCEGRMKLYEAAMANLSGLSRRRVRSTVKATRSSAFVSLHTRAGLSQSTFPVFQAAVGMVQTGLAGNDLILAIVDQVEEQGSADPALLSMLYQIAADNRRHQARNFDRQLLLAA
ncbi:MAG: DUF2336 domain-containing protein [Pseudomonadota bacterium]